MFDLAVFERWWETSVHLTPAALSTAGSTPVPPPGSTSPGRGVRRAVPLSFQRSTRFAHSSRVDFAISTSGSAIYTAGEIWAATRSAERIRLSVGRMEDALQGVRALRQGAPWAEHVGRFPQIDANMLHGRPSGRFTPCALSLVGWADGRCAAGGSRASPGAALGGARRAVPSVPSTGSLPLHPFSYCLPVLIRSSISMVHASR
jgi:hypothetical protein